MAGRLAIVRIEDEQQKQALQYLGIYPVENWINATDYSSLKEALNAVGSRKTILLVSQPIEGGHGQEASLTVEKNVTLQFLADGKLNVEAGKTVTIEGSIEAGRTHIFSGEGDIRFGAGKVTEIYPEWWGAAGDWDGRSGTDDTAAFQAACAAIKSGYTPGEARRTNISIPTLRLAARSYLIKGQIDLPDFQYLHIQGVNRQTTFLVHQPDGDKPLSCIKFYSTTPRGMDISIDDSFLPELQEVTHEAEPVSAALRKELKSKSKDITLPDDAVLKRAGDKEWAVDVGNVDPWYYIRHEENKDHKFELKVYGGWQYMHGNMISDLTLISCSTQTDYLLHVAAQSSFHAENLRIAGIWEGIAADYRPKGCLYLDFLLNCSFERLRLQNARGNNIDYGPHTSTSTSFDDCYIGHAQLAGLKAGSVTTTSFNNCVFESNHGVGIDLGGVGPFSGADIALNGCHFEYNHVHAIREASPRAAPNAG